MTPKPKAKTKLPSIAALNAQFQAMTNVEKRHTLAKEGLARLKARRFVPIRGKWVSFKRTVWDERLAKLGTTNLQEVLRQPKGPACEVCALGSIICGLAAFENKIDLEFFSVSPWTINSEETVGTAFSKHRARLEAIFGFDQLALIESTFERGNGWLSTSMLPLPQILASKAFAAKHTTDRALFKAIFSSIAAHPEGLFVPPMVCG